MRKQSVASGGGREGGRGIMGLYISNLWSIQQLYLYRITSYRPSRDTWPNRERYVYTPLFSIYVCTITLLDMNPQQLPTYPACIFHTLVITYIYIYIYIYHGSISDIYVCTLLHAALCWKMETLPTAVYREGLGIRLECERGERGERVRVSSLVLACLSKDLTPYKV